MDIDEFIAGIQFQGGACSLASPGFTSYYSKLLLPLGKLTGEEFAISSILNFSAQQLSNRTRRDSVAHAIAHFTNSPEPFFSAMVLKLVGYSEVHFLPISTFEDAVYHRIRRNLELNNNTEVRDPYLHRGPDVTGIAGQFGLIHLVDTAEIPSFESIAGRIARFSDIVAFAPSLAQVADSLQALGYFPLVQRILQERSVAVFRHTRLPAPRELVKA
jgi:hypothetical protein